VNNAFDIAVLDNSFAKVLLMFFYSRFK